MSVKDPLASKEFMEKYFPDEVEYPHICGGEPILEPGRLWSYVSNTLLNGFLNYPTIVAGMLLTRYRSHSINSAGLDRFRLADSKKLLHTDMDEWFEDDVHLLGRDDLGRDYNYSDPKEPITYWYFWYDMDCSDCSIGRFVTTDPLEVVELLFEGQCHYYQALDNSRDGKEALPLKIPVEKLSGWKKY